MLKVCERSLNVIENKRTQDRMADIFSAFLSANAHSRAFLCTKVQQKRSSGAETRRKLRRILLDTRLAAV
jgi:hypothetical protein